MLGRQAALLGLALFVSSLSPESQALGQDPEQEGQASAATFAGTRWAMSLPDRDPVDACVGGFWTFHFLASGYFVYSQKTRGVWRVDQNGNIRLKTRDGIALTLLVSGTTFRPNATVSFVKRSNIFQRCPE